MLRQAVPSPGRACPLGALCMTIKPCCLRAPACRRQPPSAAIETAVPSTHHPSPRLASISQITSAAGCHQSMLRPAFQSPWPSAPCGGTLHCCPPLLPPHPCLHGHSPPRLPSWQHLWQPVPMLLLPQQHHKSWHPLELSQSCAHSLCHHHPQRELPSQHQPLLPHGQLPLSPSWLLTWRLLAW